jgi:hypothetical protein
MPKCIPENYSSRSKKFIQKEEIPEDFLLNIRGKIRKTENVAHLEYGKVLKSVLFSGIVLVYIKIPHSEKYLLENLWRPRLQIQICYPSVKESKAVARRIKT